MTTTPTSAPTGWQKVKAHFKKHWPAWIIAALVAIGLWNLKGLLTSPVGPTADQLMQRRPSGTALGGPPGSCVPVYVANTYNRGAGYYPLTVAVDRDVLKACGAIHWTGNSWGSVRANQGPNGEALVLLPNRSADLWFSTGPHAACYYAHFNPGDSHVTLVEHRCPGTRNEGA